MPKKILQMHLEELHVSLASSRLWCVPWQNLEIKEGHWAFIPCPCFRKFSMVLAMLLGLDSNVFCVPALKKTTLSLLAWFLSTKKTSI